MTVPTDLQRCTGWFTCKESGYDGANTWLTDQSGLDFHMPLAFGSGPTFATRDSIDCFDLTNAYYFEMHNLIPIEGSVVFKFRTDAAGVATGNLTLFCWNGSQYLTGDHAALVRNTNWELNDYRQIFWLPQSGPIGLRATTFSGSDPSITTTAGMVALNVWHVITVAWNIREEAVRLKIGSATTLLDTISPEGNIGPQQYEDRMRFGYLKPAGAGIPAPQYVSVAEMAFFQDDILTNQAALAASLVASWS